MLTLTLSTGIRINIVMKHLNIWLHLLGIDSFRFVWFSPLFSQSNGTTGMCAYYWRFNFNVTSLSQLDSAKVGILKNLELGSWNLGLERHLSIRFIHKYSMFSFYFCFQKANHLPCAGFRFFPLLCFSLLFRSSTTESSRNIFFAVFFRSSLHQIAMSLNLL